MLAKSNQKFHSNLTCPCCYSSMWGTCFVSFFGNRFAFDIASRSGINDLIVNFYRSSRCFKGQLISKCPFDVFKSPKKPTRLFSSISGLASKKEVKSKKQGHFIPLIGGFYFDYLISLFWFDLFLEVTAEILEKKSWIFVEIWRHQKDILKLIEL